MVNRQRGMEIGVVRLTYDQHEHITVTGRRTVMARLSRITPLPLERRTSGRRWMRFWWWNWNPSPDDAERKTALTYID